MRTLKAFWNDEDGATAIEYGLIAALLSVAIIFTLTQLQGSLTTTFDSVKNALDTAVATGTK